MTPVNFEPRHAQTTRPILTKRSVISIAAADEQDLQHRHRGDGRVDLPFEILQDGDRQRGAAGTDQEQAHFQIAERGDEAEQRGRDDAGQDRGQGDAAERGPAVGAEALRRLLDGAVDAGEARRDSRTVQGMTISTWPATSPPSEPRIGSPVAISASTWKT